MKKMIVALLASGLLVGTAQAAVVYADDFESYADQAALDAAWKDDSGTGGILIPAPNGNPGQAMFHNGGATANHVFAATTPSDAQPIVWEFDLWDYDTSATRLTGGLRDNGGGAGLSSILEMGIYNSMIDPDTGGGVSGYGIRTVFINGNPANWVAFPGGAYVKQAGWHHFKATIGATSILFELDLFDDGTVDSSLVVTTDDTSAIGYNIARFGGPSGVSSAGPAGMDNLNIEVIPEPMTVALLGLGGLFLRRRRMA